MMATCSRFKYLGLMMSSQEKSAEEKSLVDELRGSPMMFGTLEEVIDDNHAIVSTAVGPEYYVSIMSFVDKVY